MLRILPRINDDVNEEWISDKTRYARSTVCAVSASTRSYVRKRGKLRPAGWAEALTRRI